MVKVIKVSGPYWPDKEEGETRYDFRVWFVTVRHQDATEEIIKIPASLDDNSYDVGRIVLEMMNG